MAAKRRAKRLGDTVSALKPFFNNNIHKELAPDLEKSFSLVHSDKIFWSYAKFCG